MNHHLCPINAKSAFAFLFVLLFFQNGFSGPLADHAFKVPWALETYKRSTLPKIEIQEDGILFQINTATLINEKYMHSFLESVKQEVGDRLINITIEGHTCDLGTASYNQSLGEKRAYKMMDIIVMEGLNINMLEVASKGEASPKVANANEQNRQKNRRVVVTVESVDSEAISADKTLFDAAPATETIGQNTSRFSDPFVIAYFRALEYLSVAPGRIYRCQPKATEWVPRTFWKEKISHITKPQVLPPT